MPTEDPETDDYLIQALRRAVAAEDAEIKRYNVRLSAGYGDDSSRTSMRRSIVDAEGRRRALLDLIEERRTTPG